MKSGLSFIFAVALFSCGGLRSAGTAVSTDGLGRVPVLVLSSDATRVSTTCAERQVLRAQIYKLAHRG